MADTTRKQLKRVLHENCQRNIAANMEAILKFLPIYINGGIEAQEIAEYLAILLEIHETLAAHIEEINEKI